MGGFGSGSWQYGKGLTSRCHELDVRYLQRNGLLQPGRSSGLNWLRNGEQVASIQVRAEAHHIILAYRHRSAGEAWQSEEYLVYLERTPGTLGGERPWFLCPARGCGRRVALLYMGNAGIFACRHCYRLAYPSQRETASDRVFRKADRIRERLGWEAGICNPCGRRPKGMHQRTFDRLKATHEQLADVAFIEMDRMMERFRRTP